MAEARCRSRVAIPEAASVPVVKATLMVVLDWVVSAYVTVPAVGAVSSAVMVNGEFADVPPALLVAVTFLVPGAAGAPDQL